MNECNGVRIGEQITMNALDASMKVETHGSTMFYVSEGNPLKWSTGKEMWE